MRKKSIAIVLVIIVICIASAGLGYCVWYNLPINKINRAFEIDDYETIDDLYIDLTRQEDINSVKERMSVIANEYYSDYYNEKITYDEVMEFYDLALENILAKDKATENNKDDIETINQSRMNFLEGEKLFDRGEYINAIKAYEGVSPIDMKNDRRAKKRIDECMVLYCSEVLEKADSYIAEEKYDEAKNVILAGIDNFSDNSDFKEKLAEIEKYLKVDISGYWETNYDFGDLIAGEIGISKGVISFDLKLICKISENSISIYVSRDSIKPALEELTNNENAMSAIYSIAENYGIKKREADFLVKMMYGGSYVDFIMDNFGKNIDKALEDYSINESCRFDNSYIYVSSTSKSENDYLEYKLEDSNLYLINYVGNDNCLSLIEYPVILEKKGE